VNARIQRLRAEVRSDREAFTRRVRELESLDLSGPAVVEGDLARAALALHHAYGALESLLARVARTVEGSLPEGADWHQALVSSMTLDIEGIRPRVLSAGAVEIVFRLLAFRHFLRHAYAVALDRKRLDALRLDAVALVPVLGADLDRLDEFLHALAQTPGEHG